MAKESGTERLLQTMKLRKDLPVDVSSHARERLLERFNIDFPQFLRLAFDHGTAVYNTHTYAFKVTYLDMTMVVRDKGKRYEVVTVLFKVNRQRPKRRNFGKDAMFQKMKREIQEADD